MATIRGCQEPRRNCNEADVVFTGKLIEDITNMTPGRQLLFGAATGLISGFTICKLSKFMCIVLGASVITLQLGSQQDYVNFNLMGPPEFAEEDPLEGRRQVQVTGRHRQPNFNTWWKSIRGISLKYPNITSGFIGGFLIGVGLA